MYANYHTHTPRCGHAFGPEREYIEKAIENGMTILGFSDHIPYFFDGGYYPDGQKMRPQELDSYVGTILSLKEEYRRDIIIHLGFEAEYYPKYFEAVMDLISGYPVEYLILGQHYLETGLPTDHFNMRPSRDAGLLTRYVDLCIEAYETGRFLYHAHPDYYWFIGESAVFEREMRRLCTRAKELDIPLEINLNGLGDGRHYPDPAFFEIASSVGNKVVLGTDVHFTEHVYRQEVIDRAMELVRRQGLELLPDLEDRIR